MAEIFDEDWIDGLEEMTEGLTESFDEEWVEGLEEMTEGISHAIEEAMEEMEEELEDVDFDRYRSKPDTKSRLVDELNNDNLLNNGKNKVTITDDEMTVNGQRVSDSQLKKYQKIIQRGNRSAFKDGKTKVELKMNGTELESNNNISFSISVEN